MGQCQHTLRSLWMGIADSQSGQRKEICSKAIAKVLRRWSAFPTVIFSGLKCLTTDDLKLTTQYRKHSDGAKLIVLDM